MPRTLPMTAMLPVFVNALGAFLPGPPIPNDDVERYLGKIHGAPSRHRQAVLRRNGVQTRHYALDTNRLPRFSNAEMAAYAVKDALRRSELSAGDLQYLAAATTQGDLLVPGHASAVHAHLDCPPLELANFQSVCASSMMALKSAYLQIRTGEKANAAVCASEFSSRWFQNEKYEPAIDANAGETASAEMEFLRWTLSDGAGAAVLEARPNQHGHSLRVEWIDLRSYANLFEPCMFAGTRSNADNDLKPWSYYEDPAAAARDGAMLLKQDFELLYRMFPTWVAHYMRLVEEGKIIVGEIDYFLAHYSAKSLREQMVALLEKTGCMIPEERWFTNLYTKGNTGSASIYIMLEELANDGRLEPGQKILCFVPESGRSIVSFALFTVVDGRTAHA
jgi:3-oxoacyl-[acyl-carrier-protein] synthase-3